MQRQRERDQISTVAQRWRSAYGLNDETYGKDKPLIRAALEALPANARAADVTAIIGNSTWCEKKTCSECSAVTWNLVELGATEDRDGALMCARCLRAALALLTPNVKLSRSQRREKE